MMQEESCPVASLVRAARRLEAKCIEADGRGDQLESVKAENELNAIRDAAWYLQPKSIAGAQFLLELSSLRADTMLDDDERVASLNAVRRPVDKDPTLQVWQTLSTQVPCPNPAIADMAADMPKTTFVTLRRHQADTQRATKEGLILTGPWSNFAATFPPIKYPGGRLLLPL